MFGGNRWLLHLTGNACLSACPCCAGVLPSVANAEARMVEIVSRRQLVELAKAQATEVSILRTEVERLRMKTFPALVQVENL